MEFAKDGDHIMRKMQAREKEALDVDVGGESGKSMPK